MDISRAVGRIYETENLTDELVDEDAKLLLDWGIDKLKQLLVGVEDRDQGDEITFRLMQVMRKLNQLGAETRENDVEVLAEEIREYWEAYGHAFGAVRDLGDPIETETRLHIAANIVSGMTSSQILTYLIEFAEPRDEESA